MAYLDRDPELPGAKFAVVSFLSPEKILNQKHIWMFAKFREQYVVDTRLKTFETFCAFLSKKHGLDITSVMKDFQDFARIHERQPEFRYSDAEEAWETFLLKHEKALQKQFDEENKFQTNVRGLKIRDVAENLPEAEMKAMKYAELDGHKFNVSIVQMGCWAPWDPELRELEKVVYAEEQLNTLHQAYEENRIKKEQLWRQEVEERKKSIIQENMERKRQNELLKAKEDAEKRAAAGT